MAVVIVQSRATAHVYRIFGALVAMLLIMGVAVAFIRIKTDRATGSPYGALDSAKAVAVPVGPLPPTPRAVAEAPPPPAPAPLVVPTPPAEPPRAPAVAAATGTAAAPAPTPSPAPLAPPKLPESTPATLPPAATALVEPERPAVPRQIALGKEAANALVPQPAPPAVVAAAAAAAAKPPRPPAAATIPATGPVPTAVKVASLGTDRAGAASDAQPGPPSGRININTASVDQLNSLPGLGRVGRYIASHRPYRSIEDLVDRRVLKARDFERIRGVISTN